eukprot:542495-Prymnesium_polylepis.1
MAEQIDDWLRGTGGRDALVALARNEEEKHLLLTVYGAFQSWSARCPVRLTEGDSLSQGCGRPGTHVSPDDDGILPVQCLALCGDNAGDATARPGEFPHTCQSPLADANAGAQRLRLAPVHHLVALSEQYTPEADARGANPDCDEA